MRDEIARFGGEFRFSCKLRSLNIEDGSIAAAITGEEEIPVDRLVLAIGHSARDTIEMLFDSGLNMQKKPFSVGFRVEHTQEFINKAMYGKFADHPALTAADYKFAVKTVNTHFVKTAPQRGVYTFCMCPGGSVVNSSSEQGGVCTNGMSRFSRNSGYSNSAVLASVAPEDLVSDHPLAGITLQREIECAAFEAAGGGYKAPAMSSREFVKKGAADSIFSTYLPAVTHADIESLFPTFIADSLKQGMMILEGNVKGFTLGDGVITAPETRSSSPVRIVRDEQFMTSVSGIYACGEGSGYAGGIMSSAVDGIKCAEAVIRGIQNG